MDQGRVTGDGADGVWGMKGCGVMGSVEPVRTDEGDPPQAAGDWTVAAAADAPRPADALDPGRRVLFLDDDPVRAAVFLAAHPGAVWVQTAAECLIRLNEPWDEVHLDHDLGGRTHVDMSIEECGMEVIRWLCREFRPHVAETPFLVHTHNLLAGLFMVLRMRERGYRAEFRPFGDNLARMLKTDDEPVGDDRAVENGQVLEPSPGSEPPEGFWRRLWRWAAGRARA